MDSSRGIESFFTKKKGPAKHTKQPAHDGQKRERSPPLRTDPDGDNAGPEQAGSVTTPTAKRARTGSASLDPKRPCSGKTFMDPVHGRIHLPGAAVELIDTPQFQRLRNLKQLGVCYRVYPGACHNRFEHSLGVCHLAGLHMDLLVAKGTVQISARDKLCVQLAGLLHDLGHGPFSHLFDGIFMPANAVTEAQKEWTHEEGSTMMIRHMIESNAIDLGRYGLVPEVDIPWICQLIEGLSDDDVAELNVKTWPRPRFLYYIISNSESGLDVDKLDYYQRDSYYSGIGVTKFANLLDSSVVMQCTDGEMRICYPEKYIQDVLVAFRTRHDLHETVYQHKAVKSVEYILCDALDAAHKGGLKIRGTDGRMVTMVEAVHDPVAYTRLNDSILDLIWNDANPNLDKARGLLLKMERRELYHLGGEIPCTEETLRELRDPDKDKRPSAKTLAGQMSCYLYDENFRRKNKDALDALPRPLDDDSFIVQIMKVHYGKKEDNPVDEVYFFRKGAQYNPAERARRVDSRSLLPTVLPSCFEQVKIKIFCKDKAPEAIAVAGLLIAQYSADEDGQSPMGTQSQAIDDSQG